MHTRPEEQCATMSNEPNRPFEAADPDYEPRERGLKRRDRFLDVATEVFLQHGFEAASLQEIVARAGGSLATLYRLFGNKEGLFRAVIERKAATAFGEVSVPALAGREPEDVLFDLGTRLLDLILSKDAFGVHRLLIAEGARSPQLREIFLATAPLRIYGALADYLKEQTAAGRLAVDDCHLAAVQFLEMVKGNYYMRGLLGEELRIPAKERRRVVSHAVEVFLHGVTPR
jgi:TetR/AcrR family transcriptional repressor of mexJK operon